MRKVSRRGLLAAATALGWGSAAMGAEAGRITGVGGVFVKSRDPKRLAAWYRDVLGLEVAAWGGAAMPANAPGGPPKVSWMAFPDTTDHMAPSSRDFMINFAIDDMDALVARLHARGVPILAQDDTDPYGRFAWVQDPDGTKVELWQPR